MKMSKKILPLLLFCSLIAYVSYQKVYNKDKTVSNEAVVPSNDPAHIVVNIFNSMSRGKIDNTKIIYGEKQKPLAIIHTRREKFHGVKFYLEDIEVSRYDPNTKSVSYSCRVPHPAVVFWQYRPIEPGELSYIHKGLEMQGRLYLVKDEQFGFRVKVTNDTNPISLYNKVVSDINRMWYMNATTKLTPKSINFNVFMLIASYSIALNIPEKNENMFVEKMIKEFNRVHPK